MAVAKSVIEFALTADASGLVGGLQKAKGEFAGLEQAAAKAGAGTGAGLDRLHSQLSSTANKMMGVGAAMTAATLPLTLALKSGMNSLIEAERRAAQTEAAIKSTGGAANVSADQIKGLTTSLRDMSGVSGATIRDGENMLLTFTNVRNQVGAGRDIFDRTTKAALDMSVAMGTDMKSAAQVLGRALQDPEHGMGRLARAGVVLSEQQKQQIRDFEKMGDTASAQGVILDQVAKQFGGSAQAFGDTAAGQAAKLDNQFTQLKMTLAEQLLPAFKKVVEVVSDGVKWFNSLDDGTKTWISTVAVALVAGGPVLTALGAVTKLVSGLVGLYGRLAAAASSAAAAETAAATAGAGAGGVVGRGVLRGFAGGTAAGALSGAAGGLLGGGDAGAVTGAAVGASAGALGMGAVAGPLGVLVGATSQTTYTTVKDTSDASNGFYQLRQLVNETRQSVADAGNDIETKFRIIRNAVGSNMHGSAEDIRTLQGELRNLAQENGIVDLSFEGTSTSITGMSGSFYTAEQSVEAATQSFVQAIPQINATVFGIQSAGAAAQATGLNVNILSAELEGSFGGWLSSEQSALNYANALAQVDTTLKNKATTELQAQQSMFGLESATAQHIQGLIDQGASEAQIQAAIDGTKTKLDEVAQKYPGLTGVADQYKGKLQELIDKAHQVPPSATTKVEVTGVEKAKADLDRLKQTINTFYGTLHIPAPQIPPPGARGGTIVDGVAHFARGGMFDRATAIVGEGKGREWVIPEDPAYRGRALGLWRQAGAALMAAGGTVGGDGASASGPLPAAPNVQVSASLGDALPVLEQIRDLLAQAVGQLGATPVQPGAPGAGPAAPGGGADGAPTQGLAAATTELAAAAAAALPVVQALDAATLMSATSTLPQDTAAVQTQMAATQLMSAATSADVPVQAGWQAALAASQVQVQALTAFVQGLTAQMNVLNATQVSLHVEHSQVEAAAGSIGGLASAVSGALSNLGLSGNALAQWLGVVLALPSGVLAGAVGAESGGVVGQVGAGMKGTRPTLVMEGSKAHDEYVIPTDPKYRSNAMSLLSGLHDDLGIAPLLMAGGGVVGKVGEAIAATTAGAMQTPWGGTGASAPGALGSATAGSLIAAAAFNAGGGGSQQMVSFAMAQTGDAYVWGAEGPDQWDCSGLVMGAAAAAGLPGLPHYSGSIYDMSQHISPGEAMGIPGAILWHPGHIAISRGDGQTIEARGKAYGVGSWPAEGRFTGGGLLPFPGASGSVSDSLPDKWKTVGKYISDKFRAAGVGVGKSVAGEDGEAGGGDFVGKISTFGGPGDFQPTAYGDSTNNMYNAGVPYAAMRLAPQGEIPLAPRSWISISKGAANTRAQLLDWGPASWTGRIVDVAPYVADAIGAATDDIVGVTGLERGGIIPAGSYDSGGYLPQGWSLAYNGTGAPEPVVPAGKTDVGSITVNITVEGSVTSESDLVDTITDALRARSRRGYAGVS